MRRAPLRRRTYTPMDREETIFEQALGIDSPAAREAFLREACAGNDQLFQSLQVLLRLHDRAGKFADPRPLASLARPSLATTPGRLSAAVTEKAGDRIGRYKLLQQIGEGGCGIVYMAEQEEPVRRRVALKIIKLGMDTRQVIARFEAERQALALMDHPCIAKVYDAGATDTGRPYFVMELVRGVKMTEHCDQRNLSTRERLDLFIKVCQAVQHAHQKGIIHRDLKPSNILVTVNDGVAIPKIIDFGIAKATTDQRLTDKTVFTAFEQFIGTPAYMSPEQAEITSVDIDTRTDIYSLGVLLYELLTGKTPFDAKELLQSGLDAMRRTIREKEPERPSTRVSTLERDELTTTAKRRAIEPPKLAHLLRGDLDWIVMKCLEKDRGRRYETANGLARDVERHLSNEPVAACPPSNLYRFQKMVRRNKGAVIAAVAVALSLLTGAVVSTAMYRQELGLRREAEAARKSEAQQRAVAQENAAKAKQQAVKSAQVAQLLEHMLQGVGPSKALGRDTTMLREILDQTAERVSRELTNQPEVEIEIRLTLADTYHELGLYRQMEAMARESVRLAQSLPTSKDRSLANSLHYLGDAFLHLGNLEQAEKNLRAAVEIERNQPGLERLLANSLTVLANVMSARGNTAEAEAIDREVLALRGKLSGKEDRDLAVALNHIAIELADRGKLAEAEDMSRRVLKMTRQLVGDEHPDVARYLCVLGDVLKQRGKLAEAENRTRQALEMSRKLDGNENPNVADALYNLQDILEQEGNRAEAESAARESLAIRRKVFGDNHADTADALEALGWIQFREGNLTEAETNITQALAIERKVLGADNAKVAATIENLASVKLRQGHYHKAEDLYRQALSMCKKACGDEDHRVAEVLANLAGALGRRGNLAEAETMQRQALAIDLKVFGNEHPAVAAVLRNLAITANMQGKRQEAEQLAREAYEMDQKLLGPDNPDTADVLAFLRELFLKQGKQLEVLQLDVARNRALAERGNVEAMNSLAWSLATCLDPAVRDGQTAVFFAEKAVEATNRKSDAYLDTLAAAYAETGDFVKAVSVQNEAIAAVNDDQTRKQLQKHLELYQSGCPCREP